jgi:hypothetical protein
MGILSQLRKEALSSDSGPERKPPPGLREEFPCLTAALAGEPANGTGDATPPHTLMLFLRDGRLRLSLSNPDSDVVFFGEVEDASKGLSGVETCIREGRLGTKIERRKK